MRDSANRKSRIVWVALVAAVCLFPAGSLRRVMLAATPPVEMGGQATSGPREVIHLRADEYETLRRSSDGTSVMLEVIVGENGRVESARAVNGPKNYYDGAERIEMQRIFEPFRVNGLTVRARITANVELRSPELWLDTHVPFPAVTDFDGVQITLSRDGGNGPNPRYTVSVNGRGVVFFNGTEGSLVPGMHVARVPVETVRALLDEFRQADYFSLKNTYAVRGFDIPTFTTSLLVDGKSKRVVDFLGGEAGMPDAAHDLERKIDVATDTARWLQGDSATLAALIADRWDFAAASKVNARIYENAIERHDRPLVDRFLSAHAPVLAVEGAHDSPLLAAIRTGDLDMVKSMTRDMHTFPQDLLQECLGAAAASGNVALAELWIERGADPAKPLPQDTYRREQMSVLASAIESGKADMVRKILEYRLT